VALLIVVYVAPAQAEAKSPADVRCGPAGARTVLITRDVRVSYKADLYRNIERVYGCWHGGKTQVVYDESCDDDTGCYGGPELWVSGRYVAYSNFDCVRAPACGGVVGIRDLVTRRSLKRIGLPRLQGLDVASDGTLVWMRGADTPYDEQKPPWRVEALRPSGELVLLDESPDIDTTSLAVTRTAAYWTRAGSPQTAPLAPAGGGPVPQAHHGTWHAAEVDPQDKRPARGQCGPRSAATVFLDDDVRVTYKANTDDDSEKVWGCWRGRKAQVLYDDFCNSDIGCSGGPLVQVRGRYVAVEASDCTRADCTVPVSIHDVARRRRNETVAGDPRELDIAPNGTLVFTDAGDGHGPATGPRWVRLLPVAGNAPPLDSGEDLDPDSLALGSTRAYWMRGGQPRSGTVP
jgi:hypothetical protein